jgi:hypothetical protein
VRPTRATDVLLAGLAGLLLGVVLAAAGRRGDLIVLPAGIPVTLGLLSIAELATARSVRVRRSGHGRSLAATSIPPLAALARASVLTAGVGAGAWLVLLVDRLLQLADLDAAAGDAVVAGAGLLTSVLLVLAGLRLEGACRARPT